MPPQTYRLRLGVLIKHILVLTLAFLVIPQLSKANSLEEALSLVQRGEANLSDLVVKLKEPSNGLSILRGLQSRALFPKVRGNASLSGYRQLALPQAPTKESAIDLLRKLYQDKNVELALFMPRMEDAVVLSSRPHSRTALDASEDHEPLQNYLQAAPHGVDAYYAWEIPGGKGNGIKIIDIETGWGEHPELTAPFWNFSKTTTDHGTAVLGQLTGKRDGLGITGIVYESVWGFISRHFHEPLAVYHDNVAVNIGKAAAELSAGDLLVLEMHSQGPDNKWVAVEYWQPVFDIVKFATDRGILCVAAAGNGSANLDAPVYQDAFNLQVRDSGCVLVAASTNIGGNPAESHAPIYFTNYGSRIDAHGYGENVVTAGYGDLAENPKYTADFGGTSSATPIVGGAMAAVSGIAKASGRTLSPRAIREALRNTGTPQNGIPEKRIGNMPDLRALVESLN